MYRKFFKRLIDLVLSSVGIVVLALPMVVFALIIRIEDPGPAIFRQKRVGIHKTYFSVLKFRSMKMSTPHDMPTHMLENPDQYLLKCGRWMRKMSIDELPQLFNILRGDMSFVGFRPVCTSEKKLNALRRKMGVFEGRPGLTGYAQVLGRDSIGVARKARLDAEYQRKRSLRLDLWCIVKSVTVVLSGSGVM